MCYNMGAGAATWDGGVEAIAIQPQYTVVLPITQPSSLCPVKEVCWRGFHDGQGDLSTGRDVSMLPSLPADTFLLLGSLLSHFSLLHQFAFSVWLVL